MVSKLKSFFLIVFTTIILLFFLDYFISSTTELFHVKKDCFNYERLEFKKKNYYYYNLHKNCFAIEHKGTTPSYNVYTDETGYRIGKKSTIDNDNDKNKDKIIFLGDSFTYGFGLNYEESIPGIIKDKTNNFYQIINLGLMGYSPSMNLYNLNKYFENDQKNYKKIKKVFYILDLTDVHDESNRWVDIEGLNIPVILDENVEKEIIDTFDYKNNFRAIRFISYIINKNIRNLRKKIINNFGKKNKEENISQTFFGSFTYLTEQEKKSNNEYLKMWKKNEKFGIDKIKRKMLEISLLLKKNTEAEFYIVIHPWRETVEYGQSQFSWENFAYELCSISNCNKVINFFDEVKKIKETNPDLYSYIYFKNDLHFSSVGSKIYADKIFNESFYEFKN